jgi:hypothetical protein
VERRVDDHPAGDEGVASGMNGFLWWLDRKISFETATVIVSVLAILISIASLLVLAWS